MNIDINKIIPVGRVCQIEPHKASETTSSGLVLEYNNNTASAAVLGKVVKAGNESKYKEGDIILYRRYSQDEMKFILPEGEKSIFFVEDDEVVAVIQQ